MVMETADRLRRERYEAVKLHHRYLWPINGLLYSWMQYLGLDEAAEFSKDDYVLEVGIGKFPFYKLYRKGRFVGVDWYAENVTAAKKLSSALSVRENNDEYVVADNRRLPFKDGSFDKVVSVNGFESHSECMRVLRGGGEFVKSWFFQTAKRLKGVSPGKPGD